MATRSQTRSRARADWSNVRLSAEVRLLASTKGGLGTALQLYQDPGGSRVGGHRSRRRRRAAATEIHSHVGTDADEIRDCHAGDEVDELQGGWSWSGRVGHAVAERADEIHRATGERIPESSRGQHCESKGVSRQQRRLGTHGIRHHHREKRIDRRRDQRCRRRTGASEHRPQRQVRSADRSGCRGHPQELDQYGQASASPRPALPGAVQLERSHNRQAGRRSIGSRGISAVPRDSVQNARRCGGPGDADSRQQGPHDDLSGWPKRDRTSA